MEARYETNHDFDSRRQPASGDWIHIDRFSRSGQHPDLGVSRRLEVKPNGMGSARNRSRTSTVIDKLEPHYKVYSIDMLSIFCSPSRYTQGPNATASLGREIVNLGLTGPALIVAGKSAIALL